METHLPPEGYSDTSPVGAKLPSLSSRFSAEQREDRDRVDNSVGAIHATISSLKKEEIQNEGQVYLCGSLASSDHVMANLVDAF